MSNFGYPAFGPPFVTMYQYGPGQWLPPEEYGQLGAMPLQASGPNLIPSPPGSGYKYNTFAPAIPSESIEQTMSIWPTEYNWRTGLPMPPTQYAVQSRAFGMGEGVRRDPAHRFFPHDTFSNEKDPQVVPSSIPGQQVFAPSMKSVEIDPGGEGFFPVPLPARQPPSLFDRHSGSATGHEEFSPLKAAEAPQVPLSAAAPSPRNIGTLREPYAGVLSWKKSQQPTARFRDVWGNNNIYFYRQFSDGTIQVLPPSPRLVGKNLTAKSHYKKWSAITREIGTFDQWKKARRAGVATALLNISGQIASAYQQQQAPPPAEIPMAPMAPMAPMEETGDNMKKYLPWIVGGGVLLTMLVALKPKS